MEQDMKCTLQDSDDVDPGDSEHAPAMPGSLNTRIGLLYWCCILPPLLCVALVSLYSGFSCGGRPVSRWMVTSLLVFETVAGFLGPIWLRILTVRRAMVNGVGLGGIARYFHAQLLMVGLAAWGAALAYVMNAGRIPACITMMIALYAAYFYYPSRRRIDYELRLLRSGRKET